MDVQEFHKVFLEEVKATAATEGAGSNAAFVNVASGYLIDAEVLTDFVAAFYLGKIGTRKLRVDGYYLDEFDFTFNLVIADYTGDDERETITRTYANQQFDFLVHFIEESYGSKLYREVEPSTPAADLVEQLRFHKDRIRKFRLIMITDGFMSNRISEMESRTINGIPAECQIWDIDRIYRVCSSDLGRQAIGIDFKAYTNGKGIPCLEASNANNEDYRSYLCIIPGSVLADIYDTYDSQLLEGNVRSFLSTKVAVNKKIRETILRIPQNFFAYNNGISATAMDLQFETTSEGKFITYARDFQIINGGQTTASLSNARHKDGADLSLIYVQMKLTEVDSDADKSSELIRNISRSSNSQNKVSDADFFATHPFHIRMEQISRRLFAPASGGSQYETKWFYERARGQYLQAQMRMTKSQKDKFIAQHPKKQVITKTDFAKYRNSWAGMPQTVSRGAQTNFMKFAEIIDEAWSKSDAPFNDKFFKDTVSLAILFKHTEWIVSHQPWFEQGYRANIVTYSIALLHRLIRAQFPDMDLDLQLIWTRQQVSDVVTNELVKITKYVFDRITDPSRGTINVTQWCKRDFCWEDVKKCDLRLSPEIKNVLINKDDTKSAEKEARRDQKLCSDVEAQTKVIELSATYWLKVNEFVLTKGLAFSPDQAKAMKYALKIPTQFPSGYQSMQLLKLLEEAKANGFKD